MRTGWHDAEHITVELLALPHNRAMHNSQDTTRTHKTQHATTHSINATHRRHRNNSNSSSLSTNSANEADRLPNTKQTHMTGGWIKEDRGDIEYEGVHLSPALAWWVLLIVVR